MIDISKEELKKIYATRVNYLAEFLRDEKIGCTIFIDNEEHRDVSVRYLTGHPSDAVLFVFDDASTILVPWDEILAKKNAICDKMIPFTKYKNSAHIASYEILKTKTAIVNKKVEVPPTTSYIDFLKFIDFLQDWDVKCNEFSSHQYVAALRSVKDEYEIQCIKEACRIGDLIINKIEEEVKNNNIKTEIDVALLIEKECRLHGCEKTGFETLAANPSRSWAIHCFPNYTNAPWPSEGLSILDFGVVYNGYTSDTTLTIAKGALSEDQEQLLSLVQKAADECLELYKPGLKICDAAAHANKVFAKAKRKMPHSLGHAIGLEVHEFPRVSTQTVEQIEFDEGMVLTLEPGLYDEKLGGCRLENDILITKDGNEVISNSRIIRID